LIVSRKKRLFSKILFFLQMCYVVRIPDGKASLDEQKIPGSIAEELITIV